MSNTNTSTNNVRGLRLHDHGLADGVFVKMSGTGTGQRRAHSTNVGSGGGSRWINCIGADTKGQATGSGLPQQGWAIGDDNATEAPEIFNCLAIDNLWGVACFKVSSGLPVVVKNCMGYRNIAKDYNNSNGTSVSTESTNNLSSDGTAETELVGDNRFYSQSVLFLNEASDWRLSSEDFAARNRGITLAEVPTDFFDTPRPYGNGTFDIGVIESTPATSDGQIFPLGLNVTGSDNAQLWPRAKNVRE